jgi:hypothetical protein
MSNVGFRTNPRSRINHNSINSRSTNSTHIKPIHTPTVLKTTACLLILVIALAPLVILQHAYAAAPVTQITSAKALNQDILTSRIVEISPSSQTVKVDFQYRGFDDNDHILQLQCSWDGTTYAKSNCSTESAETQMTINGVIYYIKTGTASSEFPVDANHFFGVKVINENGTPSPAATLTFDVKISSGSASQLESIFPKVGDMLVRSPAYITARFTEPLQDSSVSTSTFTVKEDTGQTIPGTVTNIRTDGTHDPRFAMFKPQDRLEGPKKYVVSLDGLKDLAGNSVGPYLWTFSVSDRWDAPGTPSPGSSPNFPSNEKIKVKVKFDSITVHDNHEDFGEGTGEYGLYAFVQGKGIDLAKASEFGVCGGDPKYCGGIWEASDGETIKFQPNAQVTVDSTELFPLSVSANGLEEDGCTSGSGDLYTAERMYPVHIFQRYNEGWHAAIADYQKRFYERFYECSLAEDSHELGKINEIYFPEKGDKLEGRHSFDSSTGDYTLRFTISVE